MEPALKSIVPVSMSENAIQDNREEEKELEWDDACIDWRVTYLQNRPYPRPD